MMMVVMIMMVMMVMMMMVMILMMLMASPWLDWRPPRGGVQAQRDNCP